MSAQIIQGVLDTIAARQWRQPGSYRERYGDLSAGELDQVIAALRVADDRGNYPLVVTRENDGRDWTVALGMGNAHDDLPVYVTTDRVRASEIRGDALDDAECYVTLRNNAPRVIAALEELLCRRLAEIPPERL